MSGSAVCGLTHEAIPHRRSCCHHNAALTVDTHIPLDLLEIAPWVADIWGDRPSTLLAAHPSAPDVAVGPTGAALVITDLALPLVYGIPAAQWADVVDRPTWIPTPPPPPHLDAAISYLERLEVGDEGVAERAALIALCHAAPIDTLEEPWRTRLRDALADLDLTP